MHRTAIAACILGAATAAAALSTGAAAPAASAPAISQSAIAGAKLGRHDAAYRKLFGSGFTGVLDGPDYPSLEFDQAKVSVFFRSKGTGAIIITTWNKKYRTSKEIGPCSTLAHVMRVYAGAVKPAWAGTLKDGSVHSYVVGNDLLLATQDMCTISAVALYHGSPDHTKGGSPQAYANYVAATTTPCF
jgi:hypothetical protein